MGSIEHGGPDSLAGRLSLSQTSVYSRIGREGAKPHLPESAPPCIARRIRRAIALFPNGGRIFNREFDPARFRWRLISPVGVFTPMRPHPLEIWRLWRLGGRIFATPSYSRG